MNRKPIYQPETGTWCIPLTRDYETVVDDVDAGLADVLWTALLKSNTVYARRSEPLGDGKRGMVYLHRVVLALKLGRDLSEGEHVDHIDGNGLNNTRANLRVCSHRENMANRGKQSNNASGFKGVYWNRQRGKWHVQTMVGGERIHLGYYTDKDEAHIAYCTAVEIHHGEFANDGGKT